MKQKHQHNDRWLGKRLPYSTSLTSVHHVVVFFFFTADRLKLHNEWWWYNQCFLVDYTPHWFTDVVSQEHHWPWHCREQG